MITLSSKNYTADAILLCQILGNTTKVNMLKVCKKFDLALQEQERTIGKRPEKDGVYEGSVWGINILIPLLATTASRRGNSSIAKDI